MNIQHFNSEENCLSIKNLRSEYYIGLNIDSCGDTFNHYLRRGYDNDTRIMAGLKIFSFIVIQSWRRSRKEIKQLKQCIDDLKRTSARTESQLRVHSTLVKAEQNRTDELTLQLKRTLDNLKRKTDACKTFMITLANLKSNQGILKEELRNRYEEYDALNEVLSQTKRQLFRSMQEQRNIHLQLCKEQRKVQSLENVKKLLITEIRDLNSEHRNEEENFIRQLRDKDGEIIEAKKLLEQCELKFYDVQKNLSFYDRAQKGFLNIENEFRLTRFHATEIHKNSLTSILQRLSLLWARVIEYPKYTLNCVYILSYYLLPAMPSTPTKYDYNSKYK